MANREFLMKAHVYQPGKTGIAGWFVSEKLDGFRCWWDGGFTRGKPCDQVPWANVAKHSRFIVKPLATGLWSSYGNPIQAPDWFLDGMPVGVSLDGELFAGRGQFQYVSSCVRTLVPQETWRRIRFLAFDSPCVAQVLQDGRINGTHYKKDFKGFAQSPATHEPFQTTYARLCRLFDSGIKDHVELVKQERLPFSTREATERLESFMDEVVLTGGEGIMIRSPMHVWTPKRVRHILKYKPFLDSEGVVVGYTWGRKTELGSKLLGKMGNLLISWRGKEFELSGFTDEERVMTCPGGKNAAFERGANAAGERAAVGFYAEKFPIGTVVTFKYRELTDAGIPKEARYWRPT